MITSLGSLVSYHPLLSTFLITTFLAFCILFYQFLSTTNSRTYYWTGKMVSIITMIIIGVTTIALLYHFMNKPNLSQRGWTGLVTEILFYIPCKIQDVLIWFSGEVNNTPQRVFFLLIIEIAIIVWIFYYKQSLKWFSIGRQVFPIYNHSTYLKNEIPIASYTKISKITGTPRDTVPMKFGISFWLSLNTNTQSLDEELPIFCYGGGEMDVPGGCSLGPYGNQNVHPAITFIPTRIQPHETSENIWEGAGLKWSMGHLKVYFSHCSDATHENSMILDIPLQRWNLVTLNYTSQRADVFINGELVASHSFKEMPIYNTGDSITVGGSGLQGAIQDIQYSLLPFSRSYISTMYNNNQLVSKILPNFILR